eukprot:5933828-Amphidinium_carterae.1
MARHGTPAQHIQLLGRWSSQALDRYIQEAPLQQSDTWAPRLLHAMAPSTGMPTATELTLQPRLIGPGASPNIDRARSPQDNSSDIDRARSGSSQTSTQLCIPNPRTSVLHAPSECEGILP